MKIDEDIPTINAETFDDLSSILEDDFYDLLNDFLKDTPPQLAQLNTALEQSDSKEIFKIGHSQSGASGNLGLDMFHTLCTQICAEALNENIENCRQLCKLLDDNFSECKTLLTEKINNR